MEGHGQVPPDNPRLVGRGQQQDLLPHPEEGKHEAEAGVGRRPQQPRLLEGVCQLAGEVAAAPEGEWREDRPVSEDLAVGKAHLLRLGRVGRLSVGQ